MQMALLDLKERAGFLVLDPEQCEASGKSFRSEYVNASPFPSIVLDDFISSAILRQVVAEFPDSGGVPYYNRAQEKLKYQYGPQYWTGHVTHNLFAALNSSAFLTFLENLTGIEGLIVDPWYMGGGLHETKSGGHLGIHADFNLHKRMNLVRRLNLLIYLNEDWPSGYGGNLELWDKQMKACRKSVPPVMGRAVIFSTDLDSFHGQPDPVSCPVDRSRCSMALYYYTSPKESFGDLPDRNTNFKTRPSSNDKVDWKIKCLHLFQDWTPPAVRRGLRKMRGPSARQ